MNKLLLIIGFVITTSSLVAQVFAYPAPDLYACDINNDGFAIFDLTVNDAAIIGPQNPMEVEVLYYLTEPDAHNGTNQLPFASSFMSAGETIFAVVRDINSGYFAITTFELFVNANPSPAEPTPLIMGEDDGDGFAIFDLTLKDNEISNGEPDVSIKYYESLVEAEDGMSETEIESPYQNVIAFSQTVYARVGYNQSTCYAIVSLELLVQPLPPIIQPIDIGLEDDNGDGIAIFDLTVNETIMLEGLDSSNYIVFYFEGETDAENRANPIDNPTAYQNIENPQAIYVRVEDINSGLFVVASFIIRAGILTVNSNEFEDLSVFPNPTSDTFTIQSSQLVSETTISLYDIQGKLLFSENVLPQIGKVTTDVSFLKDGIYFVRISSEENISFRKLIKL